MSNDTKISLTRRSLLFKGAGAAAAGNHVHAASAITATAVPGGSATNVQGILAELEARIAALEALQA